MNTRLSKYNEDGKMSRVSKNDELYRQINDSELDSFTVRNNATVIGNQEQEIDIEKIKKILDKKYNEVPKRRSIRIEEPEEEIKTTTEATKEYDLSKVLEKAKDEKVETYEENRAKKLRNTQYDILSNLNIESEEKEKIEDKESREIEVEDKQSNASEERLMNLINTIAINEAKTQEEFLDEEPPVDPLSILTDLKGDDDTQVYESMGTKVTSITEIKEKEEEMNSLKKADDVIKSNKDTIDNSFYTKNLFKKKDFEKDEGNEFIDDDKLNIGVKILIGLVIICFAVGLFLFLKSFLDF